VRHHAYEFTGADGSHDVFEARLDVEWEVHVEGRDPYRFSEVRRSPLWTVKGAGHGRRWYHVRVRGTHGLLREVGVPCRVHPERPDKIDIDWQQAYDDHQDAWARLDAVGREYTSRAEGPLGKLLAPVQFLGARKLSAEEQAEVVREVDERIEREARLPPEQQAEVDENEWIAAQGLEARRLFKEGRKTPARVVALTAPAPGSLVYVVSLEVAGIGPVEHHQALNEPWAAKLQPGSDTSVMVDPADPRRMTLA
jgi:hypothetical protein